MGRVTKRGPCAHAGIIPNRAGKIVMSNVWPCNFPLPELPAMPVSITGRYGYSDSWPPGRRYVDRDDCEGCPCWTKREVTP